MRNIYLLDCTLRDGGYINNWNFGHGNIVRILRRLAASRVDYIECGYLSEQKGGSRDETQFRDLESFFAVVPEGVDPGRLALMIDFGQYRAEKLPPAAPNAPLLRVCFHKQDAEAALAYCEELMRKGYGVFVQPMAALNYSDTEFIGLIHAVNRICPKGFYIVDSFGVIEIEDFQRLLSLAQHNLAQSVALGYHGHNNLQQAYGNAKYMVEQKLDRAILIDASVYGMGRGAGNLNTELFAAFLNKNCEKHYGIDAFLDIMDEVLKPIFVEHSWGYSLPFYLSAQYNCHPNYAGYYADKNTLSNKSVRELLASLPAQAKEHYSVELAEEYYQAYQKKYYDDAPTLAVLEKELRGKELLILAPGKSLETQQEAIRRYMAEKQPVVLAVNVAPEGYAADYLFCANEKRFSGIQRTAGCTLIVSSNITQAADALKINYSSYLSENADIADNPTLMVFRLLIALGIPAAAVAGFDGYGAAAQENYFDKSLSMGSSLSLKLKRNGLIKAEVAALQKQLHITFVTPSKYTE